MFHWHIAEGLHSKLHLFEIYLWLCCHHHILIMLAIDAREYICWNLRTVLDTFVFSIIQMLQ